jgi:insulysin
MRSCFVFFLCLGALVHSAEISLFSDVADHSLLPLKNPDLATRATAKLELPNGLSVLLISDPSADQSSASIAVGAGSWNDPENYPGMAHFCEHMLFRGTHKYPDEDFFKPLSDLGGSANAYTSSDRTVYMFSCKHDGFLSVLDRFSRFFIDPLFDPSHIARELHAVDQEHAKNIEHDGWREYMIFKEMGHPNHPNKKFSTGNAETLGLIPGSALRSWYQAHYRADKMSLFLYSNLKLDALKAQVAALFSPVLGGPKQGETLTGPITSERQKGHITYVSPIQNRRTLTLLWELPPKLSNEPTQSAELIAYALGRGQKNSLHELLKNEGLIDELGIYSEKVGGNEHTFFRFVLNLTPKGVQELQTVALRCFEGVASLKKSGVPQYLFDERNELAALKYQYQSRQDAFQMAESIGGSLPDEPLSTFPRQQLLGEKHDPSRIGEVLKFLTPKACCISLVAPPQLTGVTPTEKEKWMQAEYTSKPIPKEWALAWEKAKPNPQIQLGPKNPFLAEHLSKVALQEEQKIPTLLSNTPQGIAYYARVPEFGAPEAAIYLHISSAAIAPSAKGTVLSALYLDHLTDLLHPTLVAAEAAGLYTRFDSQKLKINLQISGFSEKAPVLLQEILRQMPLNPPTKEQFAIYWDRHEKAFANKAKELPVAQAKMLLDSLLMSERSTPAQQLDALRSISYEEFLAFHQALFEKTYVEALFAGNLSVKEAQSAWLDVNHLFSKEAYTTAERIAPKVLELPAVGGPFVVERHTESQGNGAILAIDQGLLTFESRAVQETLNGALKEAFFNELRTKQKTGYIAKSDLAEIEGRLFQFFLVQSNSHQPDDLLARYELFLEEFLETITASISENRFDTLKDSCIHSLTTRFRNIKEKASLWDLLAFEKGADFAYIEKRIAALQELSYEKFLSAATEMLKRTNRKRLAVLFEGRLKSPFAYEPVDTTELLEKGRYTVKSQVVQ